MKFLAVDSATKALKELGGRYFAGSLIRAEYIQEHLYNAKFPKAADAITVLKPES